MMEQVSTSNFEQVWKLVQQLPVSEQLKLNERLEQNISNFPKSEHPQKLSDFLSLAEFEPEEIEELFSRNKDTGRDISL